MTNQPKPNRRVTPRIPKPQLSLDTLNFLCEVLSTVQLYPSNPDYLATATKIQKAKDELIAAVTVLDPDL